MSTDGDGNGGGRPASPVAEIVNLADLFATHCQVEHRGEYSRVIFLTEAVIPHIGTVETELIPCARIVMTPSGLMQLAEAVLAAAVKRRR
jgi:hypothetical protein